MHRLPRAGFFAVTLYFLSALLAQTTNQIDVIGSALQAKQFDKALDLFIDENLPAGNFGKASEQQLPRNWQIGAKISF